MDSCAFDGSMLESDPKVALHGGLHDQSKMEGETVDIRVE